MCRFPRRSENSSFPSIGTPHGKLEREVAGSRRRYLDQVVGVVEVPGTSEVPGAYVAPSSTIAISSSASPYSS